jgi:uncharacterized membrane protein
MYSKAKIAGHPIHPMVVPFPIALYTTTLVTLITYRVTGDPFWFRAALVANGAGLVMAVIAAVLGAIDALSGIPRNTHARDTARNHALLNVTALALFAINFGYLYNQSGEAVPDVGAGLYLSALGVLATIGAGAYGWKLVQTHHVGVLPLPSEDRAELERVQRSGQAAKHDAPPADTLGHSA